MNSKKIRLLFLILLLILMAGGSTWLFIHKYWGLLIASIVILAILINRLMKETTMTDTLLLDFVEAAKYKDFTRNFSTRHHSKDTQKILEGLNTINQLFKDMLREKKVENLYLHTILETVGIGILAYEEASGNIEWMNEHFKKIIDVPYLLKIQSLEKRNPELTALIKSISTDEHTVFELRSGVHSSKVFITASRFSTEGKNIKLISIQNVNDALDETESLAWQKLLNVMTHEIMNSVAPISSLADTLIHQLNNTAENNPLDAEDLKLGLTTIKNRSEGLQRFAVTYRNLNKITKPVIQKTLVRDIFRNIQLLMQPTLDQKNIELNVILKDPQLSIYLDSSLIEQVLINLITNSIEALKQSSHPSITLSAYIKEERPIIKLTDNGKGISPQISEQIFVPFFSTRKNGNGIGLSLCKQIMLLHKGNIQVQSEENIGTAFLLNF